MSMCESAGISCFGDLRTSAHHENLYAETSRGKCPAKVRMFRAAGGMAGNTEGIIRIQKGNRMDHLRRLYWKITDGLRAGGGRGLRKPAMKVIFLDIDGVLNHEEFFMAHIDEMEQFPVDPACVRRIKEIVDATGARIVLTSSWRMGWNRGAGEMDELCRRLVEIMAEFDLEIYDKTDWLRSGDRGLEIREWINKAPLRVERFVIIDDNDFHWAKRRLDSYWIQTDFSDGGLKEEHVPRAVKILTDGRQCAE